MPHHAPSTRLPSSLALAALLAAAYAAPPEAGAETPAPAAKALTFDVAAGPLDQVLLGISRQSGLLISFEQSLVRGRQAPAVRGPLSVDQALEQALRGSGLQFRRSERGAVISAAPLRAAVPAAKVQSLAAKAEQTLERVVVTGSRIPRAQQEGPSPVTVISSEEIQNRGYRNVFEALQTQTQNTGMTQGEDYGNTWQPAANALNLRDLGPNHTLVLINGRRVADYPTAYGGSVNFTNLANIPAVMIDRIEILSGGASAIYGSDAIAGVVNIVLKKKFDGVDVNLRAGTTERGGGDNQRLQLVGGGATGDFEGLFGLQVEQRQPVWANQRGFMDSYPDGNNVGYRLNPQSGRYLGDASCAGLGGLFGGNVAPVPGARGGYRCMTDQYYNNYWTLQTKKENYDGYAGGTWHLSDSGKLFADLLFGFDHLQNNTRGPSFTSPDFINASSGDLERWYRLFSPEEIGGKSSNNSKWREVSWTGTLGLQRPRRQYLLGIRTGRDPLRVPQRPHYPLHPGGRDPRPVPGPQARRTRWLPGLRSRSGAPRTSAERGRMAQPAAQRDPAQRVLLADLQLHRQRRAVRPAGRPGGLRRRAGGGQAGLQDPPRFAIQRRLPLQTSPRPAAPAARATVTPPAANSASRCMTRCWRPPPAAGTSTGSAVAPRSRLPTTWGWSGAR
ncbi:putative TonB-dependent receptor [Pseudomonas aeruginosa]|nr:putative TonB-dependent receptor [Pseudomonas aeruginosa]